MSDRMTCMPFQQLLDWVRREHDEKGTVFGVHRPYIAESEKDWNVFERKLETPIGPAAGPNTCATASTLSVRNRLRTQYGSPYQKTTKH